MRSAGNIRPPLSLSGLTLDFKFADGFSPRGPCKFLEGAGFDMVLPDEGWNAKLSRSALQQKIHYAGMSHGLGFLISIDV